MYEIFLALIGVVASGLFGLIGWVINLILGKIKELEKEHRLMVRSLSDHKIFAAENFATKLDVKDGTNLILERLDRIDTKLDSRVQVLEDKLDRKVDK